MSNAIDPVAISRALAVEFGTSMSLSSVAGENDNFLAVTPDGVSYVAKVASPSTCRERIELEHVAVEAIVAADLGIALPSLVPNQHGDVIVSVRDVTGCQRYVRLLEFVPGDAWGTSVPASSGRLRSLGGLIAQIAVGLRTVDMPAARHSHEWDLARVEAHWSKVEAVDGLQRQQMLATAFERWAAVTQDLLTVPRGLIHGDLNDDNILIDNDRICGLLDFGDALINPLVCDLAIAMAYILLDHPDPWNAGAQIVAGYHEVRPLSETEAELLFPLLMARLAVSLVISDSRRRIDPERDAWFVTEKRAWSFLERFGDEDPVHVADRLTKLCSIRPYSDRGATAADLLERRSRTTSTALSLNYDKPIKFIRGRGAYLIDERGRPYLDLYNNVCHVGHCHPHVVQAGKRQMEALNTNTRYLTDAHVDYLERLTALLPPSLDTVFLVNSGSEANELALRLARTHSGHHDVLVVDNAYHGHTDTLINISPYKFNGRGGQGQPSWVHVASLPPSIGDVPNERGDASAYADHDAIERTINEAGRPIAAFIAETLLSCGGQVIPPLDFFETAFRHVRAAGGVCILDEVQVGFGRVGTHFWAFERYGVTPDIVVLGKPIGNGHPMAAVVCTRAVAASFESMGMEYFATFGGNPVSCAIGLAVLDVIKQEGLQEHAHETGGFLLKNIGELAKRHGKIGAVRGVGLFAGIEINEEDGVPSPVLANRIVEALRQRRILVGTDGPHNNVIKIKPPLPVATQDIARFVLELDDILTKL